jgi:hypothetical protein
MMFVDMMESTVHIDITDGEGYSPLIYSIVNRREEAAILLIGYGASVNSCVNSKRSRFSPIYVASKFGCNKVVQVILNDPCFLDAPTMPNRGGAEHLFKHGLIVCKAKDVAVSMGTIRVLKTMISFGFRATTSDLRRILRSSYRNRDGRLPAIQVLVESGYSINGQPINKQMQSLQIYTLSRSVVVK